MKKNIGISYKAFAVILAAVLVLGGTIGGTMAWLIDDTEPVENTFTYGNIDITLQEKDKGPFKIVPGVDIDKDPVVTVEANSEDCWLFVKVDEQNWPPYTEAGDTTRKVSYEISDDWKKLNGVNNVYYREVSNSVSNESFNILKDDKVTVSESLTKSEVDEVKDNTPTLSFIAYAVQKATIDSVEEAWKKACDEELY